MVRQVGEAEFDNRGMMKKGVIVRQLLLPGHVKDAKNVLKYLYETYGDRIYISMMNQYTPMPAMKDDPQLSRKVTDREYERLIDYAISLGLKNGFMQEGETAKEVLYRNLMEREYKWQRKKQEKNLFRNRSLGTRKNINR